MREGTHVAGTLHIVLAAQRIDPHTLASNIARGHGQIGNAHHHGRTLAVFGDTEPIIDRTVRRLGKGTRGMAHGLGRHPGDGLVVFR